MASFEQIVNAWVDHIHDTTLDEVIRIYLAGIAELAADPDLVIGDDTGYQSPHSPLPIPGRHGLPGSN